MRRHLIRTYVLSTFWARRVRAFLGKGWVVQRTPIVISDDFSACARPIFIVGTHRSGTSLLRRIIDSHPHIACPPETYFLKHYSAMLDDPNTFQGLAAMGFDEDQALIGMRHVMGYFHEHYRLAQGKVRWADKTPQYVYCLPLLKRVFHPGAQFVFIFRHPMDVAFSLWKRKWQLSDAGRPMSSVADFCEFVRTSVDHQLHFLSGNPSSTYTMFYDRLVDDPEPELRALCSFLEEPYEPGMLTHWRQHHDTGTEDPVARGTNGFRPSYENWRGWTAADCERAWQILSSTAATLGYARDSARLVDPHALLRSVGPQQT